MISRERAYELRALIERAAVSLYDETALSGIELFPMWRVGTAYSVGDRIRYSDILYKCADWIPDVAPALWTRVSIEEFSEWIQPTGAQDAYQKGDKVTRNSKHWESTVDANVWEPGVYGWDEVS